MTDRKTKNDFPELPVWGMIALMVATVIEGYHFPNCPLTHPQGT